MGVIEMSEREEFDELVKTYKVCSGPDRGGCACMGSCLGHYLAKLRKKYDHEYEGEGYWMSDQLHGLLKTRPGDSGEMCTPLTAENYWTGA